MDTLAYLEVKSELELRGYAFKLGVRMTGPRADLEARLAAAARDLGRDRFRQVCVQLRRTGMLLHTGFPFDSYMKLNETGLFLPGGGKGMSTACEAGLFFCLSMN